MERPATSTSATPEAPRANWVSELEQRLLSSLRALKVENHELRVELRRLQESFGVVQGEKQELTARSRQLECQLHQAQQKSRETAHDVQWLLKHSQDVLEMRQQELLRLRAELDQANSRLAQREDLFKNFPRKKVMLPRANTAMIASR